MIKHSDPEFKVVITPSEDILTSSTTVTNQGPFNTEVVPTINF